MFIYHEQASHVSFSLCILGLADTLCLFDWSLVAILRPILVPLFPIPVPLVDLDAVQLHALSYVLGVA